MAETSPQQRWFPDEIFSIIFEFYVEEAGNPWLLMHVCSQWRTAARHTRSIWSRIMITHAPPLYYESTRRYQGYEICHTVSLLRNALARAAGSPLDIRLLVGHYDSPISGDSYDDLSRRLIDPLHYDKSYLLIRRLETFGTDFEWLCHVTFDGFEFPSLEHAVLETGPCNLNKRIQSSALRLRSLHLKESGNGEVDWELSKFKRLTNFSLDRHWESSGDGAFKTIASISSLVSLYLRTTEINSFTTLSIPTLQTLNLYFTYIKDNLELPRLQTLVMFSSSIPATAEHPLMLPSLTTLELNSCALEDNFYIKAPILQTLSITEQLTRKVPLSERFEKFIEQVINPEYLSPQILCLERVAIGSNLIVRFMANLPHLEEVEIGGHIPLTKQFFEALSGCRLLSTGTSEHGEPLCTQLRAFRISLAGIYTEATYFDMKKWSHVAAQARTRGKYPLEQAVIKEKYGSQWVNML